MINLRKEKKALSQADEIQICILSMWFDWEQRQLVNQLIFCDS